MYLLINHIIKGVLDNTDGLWYTVPGFGTGNMRSRKPSVAEVLKRLMNVLIIDGQGGKIGKTLVEEIKKSVPSATVTAIGTNSIATAAMLKAGADRAATGENPVRVNAPGADFILGPIGIVLADSLLGEVTADMATAVARSGAVKILIPVAKCSTVIASLSDREPTLGEYVRDAVRRLAESVSRADTAQR